MKSDEGEEQRPSRSIGQRVRDRRRLARELQEKDARKQRAAAKKAEAAERKKDREELASSREFCRELAANWPRPQSKAVVVSEAELIGLGGVPKADWNERDGLQSRIIFGGVGETRLIFTPWRGAWMVALEGNPPLEDLKRELAKSGRGLWDNDNQKADIAFRAVDSLLSCFESFKGLPSNNQQADEVQFAIIATLQALERDGKNESRKLQVAFELLKDDQWQSQIEKLRDHLMNLAVELQRPPSKKELKDQFDPPQPPHHPLGIVRPSEFSRLLKAAGLSWLKRGKRDRGPVSLR